MSFRENKEPRKYFRMWEVYVCIAISLTSFISIITLAICANKNGGLPIWVSWTSLILTFIGLLSSMWLGTLALFQNEKFQMSSSEMVEWLTVGKDLDETKKELNLLLFNKFGFWIGNYNLTNEIDQDEIDRAIFETLNENSFFSIEEIKKFIDKINKPNNSILIAEFKSLLNDSKKISITNFINIIFDNHIELLEIDFFNYINMELKIFMDFCWNIPIKNNSEKINSSLNNFIPSVNPYSHDKADYEKNIYLLESFAKSMFFPDRENKFFNIQESSVANLNKHLFSKSLVKRIGRHNEIISKNLWFIWYENMQDLDFKNDTGILNFNDALELSKLIRRNGISQKEREVITLFSNAITCFIKDENLYQVDGIHSSPYGIELIIDNDYLEYNLSLLQIRDWFNCNIYEKMIESINVFVTEDHNRKFKLQNIFSGILREIIYENNINFLKIDHVFNSREIFHKKLKQSIIYDLIESKLTEWEERSKSEFYENVSSRSGVIYKFIENFNENFNVDDDRWWDWLLNIINENKNVIKSKNIEINNSKNRKEKKTRYLDGYKSEKDFEDDFEEMIRELLLFKEKIFNFIKSDNFKKLEEFWEK